MCEQKPHTICNNRKKHSNIIQYLQNDTEKINMIVQQAKRADVILSK